MNPSHQPMPQQFASQRLARLLAANDGGVWGDDSDGTSGTVVLRSTEITSGGRWRNLEDAATRTIQPRDFARSRLAVGDIVVTKASGSADHIGKAALVDKQVASLDACFGNFMQRLRVKGDLLTPEFLHYFLMSEIARSQFHLLGTTSTGLMNLSGGLLNDITVPLPPLAEQARISRFLDGQTFRIDQIVAARQEQMRLLNEELRASVWEWVTGYPQSGARVPSGLSWAPDLPVGWGSPRVCQVARMGTGHTPARSNPDYWVDCHIPWLTTADVHCFRHDQTDVLTQTAFLISQVGLENSSAVLHASGTVALSRTASAGFSIVMGSDMATSQDYATWTCGPRLNNMYLLWCLRAMRKDIMGRLAIGSTHKTIYFPDLMSIRVPLPPLDYQMEAIERIQQEADAFRAAERGLADSVDLLNEFKRSLISAAVSGEFDASAASGRGIPA